MEAQSERQIGEALREAIDKEVKSRIEKQGLQREFTITDVVKRYIKTPIDFSTAERICDFAGFKTVLVNRPGNPFFSAIIPKYETFLGGATSIDIIFETEKKGEKSTVKSIEANVSTSYL